VLRAAAGQMAWMPQMATSLLLEQRRDRLLDGLAVQPPFSTFIISRATLVALEVRWTLSPAQILVQVHFAQNTLKFDKAADFGLIEHYVWTSSNLSNYRYIAGMPSNVMISFIVQVLLDPPLSSSTICIYFCEIL
jgi:hypothetical protein